MGFFFQSPIHFGVSGFFWTKICIKMIINYVMKDIMELIDTPIYFMQYMGKIGIN